jgi:single-strand DNA-binding protein
MQRLQAIGRVGGDPEVRELQQTKVASFSLAVSEKWTDKSGEKKESTEWVSCVAWDKKADLISQYVHKGDQLYIEGKLKTDKYEKDGQTHYSTKVIITAMEFLGGKKETVHSNEPPASSNMDDSSEYNSDNLPF